MNEDERNKANENMLNLKLNILDLESKIKKLESRNQFLESVGSLTLETIKEEEKIVYNITNYYYGGKHEIL